MPAKLILIGIGLCLAAVNRGHSQAPNAERATHTVTIDPAVPGRFDLFSPLVVPRVGATGTIDQIDGATVVDAEASFTTAFTTYTPLTLTILDGELIGLSVQILSYTATTLTADRDLVGLALAGASYELRATPTVNSLFTGRGFATGPSTTADVIWIPADDGKFVTESGRYRIVYNSGGGIVGFGWRSLGEGARDMTHMPVAPWKGIFIQRRMGDAPIWLDFSGFVPSAPRRIPLLPGFNPVSRGTIEPLTLEGSRLHETPELQSEAGWDAIIWNPEGNGLYSQYFWASGGLLGKGWRRVGGGATDCADVPLASAFLIQRRGRPITVMLPPAPQ